LTLPWAVRWAVNAWHVQVCNKIDVISDGSDG